MSLSTATSDQRVVLLAAAVRERRRRTREKADLLPADIDGRLAALFPDDLGYPLSDPHRELWRWAMQIGLGPVAPFVAIWARGRGKSTHAEMAAAYMAATGRRSYIMYVCETQDQADKHVGSILRMLTSRHMARYYLDAGKPRMGTSGPATWRRSIFTTHTGATVEAIGINKAIRGQKIDWTRPDMIVFDDVDAKHDTENAVAKKERTITTSILPAADADDCAVLFVQNVIHNGSIAHKLSVRPGEPGAADYLADRIVSGPHPAAAGLRYEFDPDAGPGEQPWRVVNGRSLWRGFELATIAQEINREGPASFERESQHNVDADNPLALLSSETFAATRVADAPPLRRVVIGVDPSGGAGRCGIVAVGLGHVNGVKHGYTIADHSTAKGASSAEWAQAVLRCYMATGADAIVVERNFGGDMARDTIRAAQLTDGEGDIALRGTNAPIIEVTASRGKAVRAEPVAALFALARAHHVGHFSDLEKEWTTWVPTESPDSPDRLDAEVWAYTALGLIHDLEAKIEKGFLFS